MTKYFGKMECPYCDKVISVNGLGRVSHMRVHVREGMLIERKDYKNRCIFELKELREKSGDMFKDLL